MQFPPDAPPAFIKLESIDEWIPLEDCIDGALYRIECRNAQWGIFQADDNGFLIARRRWFDGLEINADGPNKTFEDGDLYEFTEYHWDIGKTGEDPQPNFSGTAKPLKMIDEVTDPDYELLKELPDSRHTKIKE